MNFRDSWARFLLRVMGPIWKVQVVLGDSKGEQLRFISGKFLHVRTLKPESH